ncbi:MAG: BCCT family transporter [Neisseria sp.]|nr:BCCT family transporter [Neisseria sp.]
MSLFCQLKKHCTFSAPVFVPGFVLIVVTSVVCVLAPQWAQQLLNTLKDGVFHYFSWFYVLVVGVFVVLMLLLALSRIGDIRLGADDEAAEFPFLSWLAMLFAAGMGVGLMYFGVAEPLMHSVAPITQDHPQQKALLYTFFHWGIHAWAIYGMIALALSYFGYRYRLPLALRSAFYPLLKEKINGVAGHMIDALALIATVFGIVTTVGYGAMQLNAGLQAVGMLAEVSFTAQAVIIFVVVSVAVLSAISGVGRGVRRLSEINLILALLLMLFILGSGSTVYLLSAFADNIGYYFGNLVQISFRTFAYEPEHVAWFNGWTVLYWAWWFSWAPFVGLFIARISRGRTVREFVFGVLIVPSLFCLLWFTVFGNSALAIDAAQQGALSTLTGTPERLLFAFLDYFPLPLLSSMVVMVVLALFFITSADSGIFVLNNIASRGSTLNPPRWQSVLWGMVLVVLSTSLLRSGGLGAVQAMTLLVALPFAVIMLLMSFSLLKGLQTDQQYFGAKFNAGSVFWSGTEWKKRLRQMLIQPQAADMQTFFKQVVRPAFDALAAELRDVHGLDVRVTEQAAEQQALELVIDKGRIRNFVYGVRVEEHTVSSALCEEERFPNIRHESTFEPMTYFGDGRQGYDVQYMSRDELIADVLKQYQRYLMLLEQEEVQLMTHAPLAED